MLVEPPTALRILLEVLPCCRFEGFTCVLFLPEGFHLDNYIPFNCPKLETSLTVMVLSFLFTVHFKGLEWASSNALLGNNNCGKD